MESLSSKELIFKKKRLIGKRDQMIGLGSPAGMMMAVEHQNEIDDIVALLNKRGHDSGYYRAYLEQEYDEHGFEYMQKKYPDIIMCGSCKKYPENNGSCDWGVKAFEEACSKEYEK